LRSGGIGTPLRARPTMVSGFDVFANQPALRELDRFILTDGHLRIQIAVLFGEVNGTFSDAAYKITRRAKRVIFKDGWQRIFDASDIREQVRDITTR
jgi:hypothetical protein